MFNNNLLTTINKQSHSAKSGDDLKHVSSSIKKIPTGLVAGWKSKILKVSHVTENPQRASSPLGGLADDDARGERPDSIQIGNRYRNHKNEVCLFFYFGPILIPSARIQLKIAVHDSDPEYIKPRPKTKVAVLSSVYIYKGADTYHQELLVWDTDSDFIEYGTPESPSEKNAPKSKKPSKPSSTAKSRTHSNDKLEPVGAASLVFASSDAKSVTGLPDFVRAKWINRFLPTLYHRFGSSKEPWNMFTKGDEMLSIIQEVINKVYPDNTYRARWGDSICNAVLIPFFLLSIFNFFLISR